LLSSLWSHGNYPVRRTAAGGGAGWSRQCALFLARLAASVGPMSPPPFVLNSALADLSATWLRLGCCGGTSYVPVRLLAGSARPRARLRGVLPRLRCQICNDTPRSAALVESPAGGAAAGWVIRLD
jgi:hypothetical protein